MLVICRGAKYRAKYGTLGFAHFVLLVALLGAAHFQGWVDKAFASDSSTGIVLLIFVLFMVGLVLCGWKIWRASHDLNLIKAYGPLKPSRVSGYLTAIRLRSAESRSITADLLKMKRLLRRPKLPNS